MIVLIAPHRSDNIDDTEMRRYRIVISARRLLISNFLPPLEGNFSRASADPSGLTRPI
jgi:hypothetical protein